MEKVGFFQSAPGRWSSTRLQSFLAFSVGCVIAVSSVFVDSVTLGDAFPMMITLLAYSLGYKTFKDVTNNMRKTDEGKG